MGYYVIMYSPYIQVSYFLVIHLLHALTFFVRTRNSNVYSYNSSYIINIAFKLFLKISQE